MILNAASLIPNRNKTKFFGIDYYANICRGSNQIFNYLSTPQDFYPLANKDSPVCSKDKEQNFYKQLEAFKEQKYFGFFQNPDIYSCKTSIKDILTHLKEFNHGLYIETNSLNLTEDLPLLETFNETNSLLIGLPVISLEDLNLSFINENSNVKILDSLIRLLNKTKIKYGFLIKPIIPYINDDVAKFKKLLKKLIAYNPSFIYPSFSLNFDSKKLNNFYDAVDKEKPQLKPLLYDQYGYKRIWHSKNIDDLKKEFIFALRKTKIKYRMRDIINLYKNENEPDKQLTLF
ncbi:MAG: hypothetical protein K9L64_00440 [Candidatus Izimaplasma sp.]|nr:hypothetical protein [Candidatus Izimaplasma bacterium]